MLTIIPKAPALPDIPNLPSFPRLDRIISLPAKIQDTEHARGGFEKIEAGDLIRIEEADTRQAITELHDILEATSQGQVLADKSGDVVQGINRSIGELLADAAERSPR